MERAFDFLRLNDRPEKPRDRGITEIRGPYYDPMGPRELRDILETMGHWVDIYKFSGGSFALMPEEAVRELIGICHDHDVQVSTGGFVEHVLVADHEHVGAYVEEAAELGFDIVEISSGFLAIDTDDLVALTELVQDHGLKAKPEINVQFGAGGASSVEELEGEEAIDPASAIREAERHLEAGAYKIMVESEGITERVREWRTDVAFAIANEVGIENCVFEAADPEVFEWYLKNFGPNVNLFVDNSQIVELECMRSGLWGKKSSWGRIASYRPE
ncbi:phosphosulfolactate synthase [Halalkalicoccus sp. NIPERK01]|uniref:phosphosulfolactate synthase n=1 Tax=Halalkalicoccus sp. NIPERK01 TaxID=3053469 RepID=UPI00256F1045|nr:phosphosulfolactate synthase [Halalkalicoccus sp. NIPERK01]MDL5361048.1 phosphosulfolactate synthase [Halalkalicoccus sp. NIPERK01]